MILIIVWYVVFVVALTAFPTDVNTTGRRARPTTMATIPNTMAITHFTASILLYLHIL
jgi:hypothetical protein